MKSRETGDWALFGFAGFGVDARAVVTVVVWLVHMMSVTFYLMCIVFVGLGALQIAGKSANDAWRNLRRSLAGKYVHVRRFNRIIS